MITCIANEITSLVSLTLEGDYQGFRKPAKAALS